MLEHQCEMELLVILCQVIECGPSTFKPLMRDMVKKWKECLPSDNLVEDTHQEIKPTKLVPPFFSMQPIESIFHDDNLLGSIDKKGLLKLIHQGMTTSVKHIENIKSLLVSRPAADGVLLTIIQAMKVFANFDMQSMKGSQVVSSYSSTMKIVPVPQEDDDNLEVNVV